MPIDRARRLEEEAAERAVQVLTNDDVPPIEGITWFAEYVTEDDVLEQWQIIVAGDSGDPVQGTVNIWFRANGEVDGWEPEPHSGDLQLLRREVVVVGGVFLCHPLVRVRRCHGLGRGRHTRDSSLRAGYRKRPGVNQTTALRSYVRVADDQP